MMTNEEMERMLPEPAVSLPAAEASGQVPAAQAEEETATPGAELLMLLDAILGVGQDG
jgi:hypothetical protein